MKSILIELPEEARTGFIFRAIAETAQQYGCKLEVSQATAKTATYRLTKQYRKEDKA